MEHRHYCSAHCGYWEHPDGHCANQGRAMTCPQCLLRFMGGRITLAAIVPVALLGLLIVLL
jgi:hypothetical protein